MSRVDTIQALYTKMKSPSEFDFDNLLAIPLYSLLSGNDIYRLNKIANSNKYASKPKLKYKMIDDILVPRGFKKFASGTNRVVYKYLEDQSIILKVALDKVGLRDNPNEYYNQQFLKPFVTKCFEISSCGTVGLFERVQPITCREEFISIADNVYDLIVQKLIGNYVLEDIGTKYFMNWGLRLGFGPVLLDYPYMFKLDGNKLYCNNSDPNSPTGVCGGVIDYDSGFNNLICEKCGKRYLAIELKKDEKDRKILVRDEGVADMRIVIKRGNEEVKVFNDRTYNHFENDNKKKRKRRGGVSSFYRDSQKIANPIKVSVVRRSEIEEQEETENVFKSFDYDDLNNIYKSENDNKLKVTVKRKSEIEKEESELKCNYKNDSENNSSEESNDESIDYHVENISKEESSDNNINDLYKESDKDENDYNQTVNSKDLASDDSLLNSMNNNYDNEKDYDENINNPEYHEYPTDEEEDVDNDNEEHETYNQLPARERVNIIPRENTDNNIIDEY